MHCHVWSQNIKSAVTQVLSILTILDVKPLIYLTSQLLGNSLLMLSFSLYRIYYPHAFWNNGVYCNRLRLCLPVYPSHYVVKNGWAEVTNIGSYDHHMAWRCKNSILFVHPPIIRLFILHWPLCFDEFLNQRDHLSIMRDSKLDFSHTF